MGSFLLILIWCALLLFQNGQVLRTDENWIYFKFPFHYLSLAGWLFVFVVCAALLRRHLYVSRHLSVPVWVIPVCIFVAGLASGHDHSITGKALAFVVGAFLLAEAGRFLVRLLGIDSPSLWMGFLASAVLLHSALFLLMELKWLTTEGVLVSLGGLAVVGVWSLSKRSPPLVSHGDSSTSVSSQILISTIVGVVFLSYMAGSVPQTMSDGVVYRLPALMEMRTSQGWPFHYYHWFRLTPQPFMILLFPAYVFLGEIGASWTVVLFFAVSVAVLHDFAKEVSGSSAAGLLVALAFAATPPFWIVSTAVYSDFPIAAFALAGLFLMRRALVAGKIINWVLGLIFLAFAATIKMNAPLMILPSVVAMGLIFRNGFVSFLRSRALLVGILAATAVAGPWFAHVYLATGNPLFPYLQSLFPTSFSPADVLLKQAIEAYGFELSVSNILLLPWLMTFGTSRFGEYLNGTFGLLPLAACGAFVILSITSWKLDSSVRKALLKLVAEFLLPALIAFLSMVIVTKIGGIRYWMPAYALALIGLFAGCTVLSRTVFRGSFVMSPVFQATLHTFISFAALGFLVVVGARMNYGVASGIGDEVYRGRVSREDFIQKNSLGVDRFINSHLEGNETVASTGFMPIHLLKSHTFYISNENALFGRMSSLDRTKEFVSENNVRFWIVDGMSDLDFLKENGVVDVFFKANRVVFGNGRFLVYDLKKASSPLWHFSLAAQGGAVSTFESPWERRGEVPKSADLVLFSIEVKAVNAPSVAIVDVFLSEDGTAFGDPQTLGVRLTAGKDEVLKFARPSRGVRAVKVVVHPWRAEDGPLEVKAAEMMGLSPDLLSPFGTEEKSPKQH